MAKVENAKMCILSYKPTDIFTPLRREENYYEFNDVGKGLENYYKELLHRVEQMKENNITSFAPYYLIFDEYNSWINSITDNKERNKAMNIMNNTLNMGREFSMFPLVTGQKIYANEMQSKDNFRARLFMGNISKTAKQMYAEGKGNQINQENQLGEAYLFIDSQEEIERVKIAKIDDFETLYEDIKKAMER